MRRLVLLCAAAAAALCACVEAPVRHMGPVATGPAEWRVSAHAWDAGDARLKSLREAADLTLAQGGEWFRVRGGDVSNPNSSGSNIGAFDDLSSPEHEARSGLSLDIQIGRGPRPAGENVYDARAVAEHLGGRPAAPHDSRSGLQL